MDEKYLIKAAREGDLDAFNQLVLAYQDGAFNVAFHILFDEAAAEDITQNSFIAAYRGLSSYRDGSFRGWLIRIVTNQCYDELRRRKIRPTIPLVPLDDEGKEVESPAWMIDSCPTPEEALEQVELRQAIQRCLEKLPEEYRSVVVLVDLQGLDYLEVSRVLGVPLGTVKSRLARGRLKLREEICTPRWLSENQGQEREVSNIIGFKLG